MIVQVSDYYVKKVEEFARKRIEGSKNLYAYRGESNMGKMVDDCVIGTIGEWGVFKYLKDMVGITTSKPDMKIYEKRRKSFSADLVHPDYRFHVKSQSIESISKYGRSWLFQKSDKVLNNPEPDEYFVFTEVCRNGVVEIIAVIQCNKLLNLYGECKVPWYRHSKVALYLDDIEHLNLGGLE